LVSSLTALRIVAALRLLLAALLLALGPTLPARANDGLELSELRLQRTDEGLLVDFSVRLELPKAVDEALHKGVPLHFVAEAELYRSRWYWRDARVAQAERTWRLSWQPLTLNYRVAFGALAQTYATLPEALGSLRRSARWKLAEPLADDDDGNYYVEFRYRLDTSLLPRPMQIGIGNQPDWQLAVERTLPLPAPTRP
jgi:hypothetical protein